MEQVLAANKDADAVGRVGLVPAERDEVQMLGVVRFAHVYRPVRRNLGCVNSDAGSGIVREPRQFMYRVDPAGDIGGAGNCDQRDASAVLVEFRREVFHVQRPIVEDPGVDHLSPSAPGQVVGVMFHHGSQHDAV